MTLGGVVSCRYQQTLNGSFSAVWTTTIGRKDACSTFLSAQTMSPVKKEKEKGNIFGDLQDFHTYAPLRSQDFSKKVVTILSFLKI